MLLLTVMHLQGGNLRLTMQDFFIPTTQVYDYNKGKSKIDACGEIRDPFLQIDSLPYMLLW